MRLFGFEITKSVVPGSSVLGDRGGWWWPVVREPFTGAWQRNQEIRTESILAYQAVYACIERIASDIAKCRLKLVEQDSGGIWEETESTAFSPLLRKPNSFQNRIQFFENWVISKLTSGNAYVLKERDNRGVVIALYVLDPMGVRVLVTPHGDVYYELNRDNLSGLTEINDRPVVPASEMIHDMMTIRYHPLHGVSPLIAAGPVATQGLNIQRNSSAFFRNNSTPGGVLTAPAEIKQATAQRLKEYWQTEFTGDNSGKIAVLGDGLKFEPMGTTAQNAQLVEQLGLTAQMVCTAFGVPAYMVGVGPLPAYNNIEALNQQYYSQCLQKHFESIELLFDEGLGLVNVTSRILGTEFELNDLLRMDTMTQIESIDKAVKAGVMKPNEARAKLGYKPVTGGEEAYLQQQNFSLAALAKRDAKEDPFSNTPKPPDETGAQPLLPAPKPAVADRSMADIEIARHRIRLQVERLVA